MENQQTESNFINEYGKKIAKIAAVTQETWGEQLIKQNWLF